MRRAMQKLVLMKKTALKHQLIGVVSWCLYLLGKPFNDKQLPLKGCNMVGVAVAGNLMIS